MCGLAIDKGRLASAAVAGVGAADVAFDASTGCFFARTTGWSGRTLDIAKMARDVGPCPLSSQKIFEVRTRSRLRPMSRRTLEAAFSPREYGALGGCDSSVWGEFVFGECFYL